MAKDPYLTIVMPAFNEALNFKAGVLNSSLEFLKKQKFSWNIIFVDDGSTDSTKRLLSNFCSKIPHTKLISIPHGGRAAAMRTGMLKAQGKYVLYTDFDQSTELSEVKAFLAKLRSGNCDLVIGSRGKGKTERKDSFLNKKRAEAFIFIAKILMGLTVSDINCGFKLYKKETAHKIFSNLLVSRPLKIKHAYMGAIDSEILFLANKYKFKVVELPVNWIRRPFVSHLTWKEPFMIILDLIKMRFYNSFGRYSQKN